jgi:hypothetical protein
MAGKASPERVVKGKVDAVEWWRWESVCGGGGGEAAAEISVLTPATAFLAASAHVCVFFKILRGWNLHRLLIQGGSTFESRACASSHDSSSRSTCQW